MDGRLFYKKRRRASRAVKYLYTYCHMTAIYCPHIYLNVCGHFYAGTLMPKRKTRAAAGRGAWRGNIYAPKEYICSERRKQEVQEVHTCTH